MFRKSQLNNMAASMRSILCREVVKLNRVCFCLRAFSTCKKLQCKEIDNLESSNDSVGIDNTTSETDQQQSKLGGFAQAFAKFTDRLEEQHRAAQVKDIGLGEQSFAKLFRHSPFVHLGDIKDQIVVGKIFHIVENDLYIDFGGKFYCVCERPKDNTAKYVRGARVRLRLKEFEMAEHFLGATQDLTLLEADAQLLGLQDFQRDSSENITSSENDFQVKI